MESITVWNDGKTEQVLEKETASVLSVVGQLILDFLCDE